MRGEETPAISCLTSSSLANQLATVERAPLADHSILPQHCLHYLKPLIKSVTDPTTLSPLPHVHTKDLPEHLHTGTRKQTAVTPPPPSLSVSSFPPASTLKVCQSVWNWARLLSDKTVKQREGGQEEGYKNGGEPNTENRRQSWRGHLCSAVVSETKTHKSLSLSLSVLILSLSVSFRVSLSLCPSFSLFLSVDRELFQRWCGSKASLHEGVQENQPRGLQ